jgi:hypothetical protein
MQTSIKSFWKSRMRHRREPRLPIYAPLTYRQAGEKVWHSGTARDVSLTGVLFQAEQPIEIGTPVEIRFREPVDVGAEAGAVVSCRGEIVRAVPEAAKDLPAALAARVIEPHFQPHPMFEVRKYVGDDRGPLAA